MVARVGQFPSQPASTPRPCNRVASSKPPFTLSQLKKSIPPHCFRRSLSRSFFYLTTNFAISFVLLYLALYNLPHIPYPYSHLTWTLLYWIPQGISFAGLWILGHKLGHHAFSDYQLVDDTLGFILHSALLVPYFSWKISHRRHHSNTGSLERDEVFVPKLRDSMPWFALYLDNPLVRFTYLFFCLSLGWPMYLLANVSGRNYPRMTSHFDPYSPLFTDNQRTSIFASDAGVITVCFLLYRLSVAYTCNLIVKVYWVPLLIMCSFLVLITFLQHTHVDVPHYDTEEWDWLRGALATVDRDFGWFLNWMFHNSTITHVAHHLFPTIPHYMAKEATEAMKGVLGEHYKFDSTPFFKAIWREAKECVYVEEEEGARKGVFWYNNKF